MEELSRTARNAVRGWLYQSIEEAFSFTRTDELRQHNCMEAVVTI
jgi:hypothetical protein